MHITWQSLVLVTVFGGVAIQSAPIDGNSSQHKVVEQLNSLDEKGFHYRWVADLKFEFNKS